MGRTSSTTPSRPRAPRPRQRPQAKPPTLDARRDPILDLPALVGVASSAPEGGKCSTMPPRGRRRRLPGALNGKNYGRLALEGCSTYNIKTPTT